MREFLKLKGIDDIKEQCTVLYRNIFYQAIYTKQGRYIIFNSKEHPVDITDKKFVRIPDGMSITDFSLLWHNNKKIFRF